MSLSRLQFAAILLGTVLLTRLAMADGGPVCEIVPLKERFVVGEPMVVDLVLRNDSATAIQSRFRSAEAFSRAELTMRVYSGNEVISTSGRRLCSVHDPLYKARNYLTGEWMVQLGPGVELRARKLFAPLAEPPEGVHIAYEDRLPLAPGKYTIVGRIPWVNGSLTTEPVDITIVRSPRREDRAAGEEVDSGYGAFMERDTGGVKSDGTVRYDSVRRILEQFPNSVHARLARSHLLAIHAIQLVSESRGAAFVQRVEQLAREEQANIQEERNHLESRVREQVETELLEMVQRIEIHLQDHPDDPLELELFNARIQLLRRTNQFSKLIKACDELMDKYPNSGFTEEAGRTREMAVGEGLLFQAARLIDAVEQSDKKPAVRKARMGEMLEIVGRIEALLAKELSSPDEWDFLKIRLHLLHSFEKMPELIKACDELIERNPQSKHAREAVTIREEFLGTGAE